MQFQDYLSNESTAEPELYNCTSCQGRNRKCLHEQYGKREVEILSYIEGADGKRIEFKIRNVKGFYEYFDRAIAVNPRISLLEACLLGQGSNVCPIPFFDALTIELMNMVDLCSKINPTDYFGQPALYIQALKIINPERARLSNLRIKSSEKG